MAALSGGWRPAVAAWERRRHGHELQAAQVLLASRTAEQARRPSQAVVTRSAVAARRRRPRSSQLMARAPPAAVATETERRRQPWAQASRRRGLIGGRRGPTLRSSRRSKGRGRRHHPRPS
eukprot:scaffold20973_cov53-Phaeocystis_antarctica.AAC.14